MTCKVTVTGQGALITCSRGSIPTRTFQLNKGLIKGEALIAAHAIDRKVGFGNHRGFTYDARTGKATLT